MAPRTVVTELGSDEGCFVLRGALLAADAHLPDNNLLAWLDETSPGARDLLVLTGDQWGPFAVTLTVHERPSGPLDSTWEDVVEVSVDLSTGLGLSELVDGPVDELLGLRGVHRLRVAAKSRSAVPGQEGDDLEEETAEPREHYRIDLWPARSAPAEIIRGCEATADDDAARPGDGSAIAEAARRIVRDLGRDAGARQVPGVLGELELVLEVPGSSEKVFNRVLRACGWPFVRGIDATHDQLAPNHYSMDLPGSEEYSDRWIVMRLTKPPKRQSAHAEWNVLPEGGGRLDDRPPLLARDSVVTLRVATTADLSRGDPGVVVTLRHEGVPAAWVDDLRVLWEAEIRSLARMPL